MLIGYSSESLLTLHRKDTSLHLLSSKVILSTNRFPSNSCFLGFDIVFKLYIKKPLDSCPKCQLQHYELPSNFSIKLSILWEAFYFPFAIFLNKGQLVVVPIRRRQGRSQRSHPPMEAVLSLIRLDDTWVVFDVLDRRSACGLNRLFHACGNLRID